VKVTSSILLLWPSVAFAATEVAQAVPPDDDFSPAVFFAFLLICAVCLVLIGIGLVAALASLAFATLLVAFGIVSSSALIALFRRRFSAGFRAFHYQLCAAVVAPCGIAALWVGSSLFHFHFRHRYILVVGLLAGTVAGIALAFTLDRLFRLAYRRMGGGSEPLPT
jgi:predicted membrane-bound spermidine synthase